MILLSVGSYTKKERAASELNLTCFFLQELAFLYKCKPKYFERFTMRKLIISTIITSALILINLTSNVAFAVNFYDGARAPQGLYFLTYSSVYVADELTDAKGGTSKNNYGFFKAQEILRFCYYSPDFVATALVPGGYTNIRSLNKDSLGLGDANLGFGHFLPFKQIDILPMLFVKFPTGEYDSSKSVNMGSGQYDISPMVFLYKALGDFSIDAVAKYFFRLKNNSTDVTPGDEIHLQCVLGYNLTDKLKLGPSVNWMISKDKELKGVRISDSARETLSMGADIYYRIGKVGVTATYLYDMYAENTTRGHFFQIKTVYRF
jgi:hypothetical protein